MSMHTIAAKALASVPVRRPNELARDYAARLRQSLPQQPRPPIVPFGQPLPPPSHAELEFRVAKQAAELVCAAGDLFDAHTEAERLTAKPRAANGRSREAYREAQRQYMRGKRARDREAKADETS